VKIRTRKAIDLGLAVLGIVVVFLAAILIPDFNLPGRVLGVLVGVLMIEAGVWNLTSPFLPTDRKYLALRREVDAFVERIPNLNRAALELRAERSDASEARFREALATLHASVDRMGTVAGRAEGEEPTRPAEPRVE